MPTIESRDGTSLNLRVWKPEVRMRGRVLLVHGLAEHMGRYEHVARALNAAEFGVWGVELRGHGDSEGRPGHTERWRDYVDDVRAAAYAIGEPFYLVGHSMGGCVALDLVRGAPKPQVLGVALSNPLLGVAVEPPAWKTMAGRLMSNIWPTLSLANEIDPTWVSRDPNVVAAYQDDPKVFSVVSARWYTELVAAMERIHGHAGRYRSPLLLLVGTSDRLVDPDASQAFFGSYGGTDKDMLVYDGFYHELFNEPEKDRVFHDLITWLRRETTLQPELT